MTTALQFFYDKAGYSYSPDMESAEFGRTVCAAKLATAESKAAKQGLTFTWDADWSVGDHVKEFDCYKDGGPSECESCTMWSRDGEILATFGCIDDADGDTRRVIEAELALEGVQ